MLHTHGSVVMMYEHNIVWKCILMIFLLDFLYTVHGSFPCLSWFFFFFASITTKIHWTFLCFFFFLKKIRYIFILDLQFLENVSWSVFFLGNIRMYEYMFVCLYARMGAWMHVLMYVSICTCIVFTHKNSLSHSLIFSQSKVFDTNGWMYQSAPP